MEEIEHPCPQLSVLGPLYPITTVAQWKGEETTNESSFPSTSHLSVLCMCFIFVTAHITIFCLFVSLFSRSCLSPSTTFLLLLHGHRPLLCQWSHPQCPAQCLAHSKCVLVNVCLYEECLVFRDKG